MREEPRRPALATTILVAGGIAHTLACMPAIRCRGYPPIDPIWYGVTYLWPLPIVVSAYFDSTRFGSRRNLLVAYSFTSAFFIAGTAVMSVPRYVDVSVMAFGALLYAPMHVAITLVLEHLSQRLYSIGRKLTPGADRTMLPRFSLFFALVGTAWLCLFLGLPLGYRSSVLSAEAWQAVEQANTDWPVDTGLYLGYQFEDIGEFTVSRHFDPETGLAVKPLFADLGFARKYNERVHELIALHGTPAHAEQAKKLDPHTMIQLLDATDLNPVTTFPVDLTENLHLMRRGTLSRWGSVSSSNSDSLSVVTPHTTCGVGDGVVPVHTKITEEAIYIRNGDDWVGAFSPDGKLLMSVSR